MRHARFLAPASALDDGRFVALEAAVLPVALVAPRRRASAAPAPIQADERQRTVRSLLIASCYY